MAAPRETAFIYAIDPDEGERLMEVLESHHLAVQLRPGGLRAAIEEASSWNIAPHYLLVDISGVDDPTQALIEVAERGPSGETDVICFGEQDEVNLYRTLRNLGVVEYLTRPVDAEDFDTIVSALIQNRRDEQKAIDPERLICVTGCRGGVGASSIAAGLSHIVASSHGRRTLLLDLDFQGGTQYVNFNIEPTPGLIDMVEAPHRIDAVFLERTLGIASQRLSVLSAEKPESERHPKSEGLDSLIKQAGQGIDTIVLDLPRAAPFGSEAVFAAGTVVVVASPTIIGLRDCVDMVNDIERGGVARRVMVAVNNVGQYRAGTVTTADFQRRMGRTIWEIPFDGRNVPQSVVRGIPVVEASPTVGRAVRALAEELPSGGRRQMSSGFLDKLMGKGGGAVRAPQGS
ncbi:MAG: hypothetical protein Alpg2KO_24070 [Alphaproteobacteria bacterium]